MAEAEWQRDSISYLIRSNPVTLTQYYGFFSSTKYLPQPRCRLENGTRALFGTDRRHRFGPSEEAPH